ncbi:MAG: MurR/RpiR family transcriptional regulator [Rhodopila sp.]|nr:MurR/RpiR family transcriptional regulator [Rhodopila sp.]
MAPDAPPLDLLRRALPDLPPRLHEVGQFLVGHEFDAATRSMRGLAAAAGANPATFTRLAQALGYAGWDDLRDALIEARRPDPATPFSDRVRRDRADVVQDQPGIAAAMLAADAVGLDRLDATAVETAAVALHSAERAWIAGFRSCRSVAELLHYQLRLFRPDTVRLVGGSGPEDLDLGAFRQGDAVVVTGFAPYSRASVMTAQAARAARCTLIALADTPAAPMAEGADHFLRFDAAAGPGFFPSLTGAIALVQALASAAFALGGQQALTRLRETEARLAAHSQYVSGPKGIQS